MGEDLAIMKLRMLTMASTLLLACEETAPPGAAPSASTAAEKAEPEEEPKAAPSFSVDAIGPQVGFVRVMLDKPEGLSTLKSEISDQAEHITGKDLSVRVDRKAKLSWVSVFISELTRAGVGTLKLRTETRDEYPGELGFLAEQTATSAPRCSTVAMILEDRSTAVWQLSGGVASRRQKGMAGPDLSMTAETLERFGKGCKDSELLFVSGDSAVEWGLVYDLAASSQRLKKGYFKKVVLLNETPVAGHKVELSGA
jgi:hypothetical protein